MSTEQKNYTKDQNELIAELSATYGIEPDQILFFNDDPKPFFEHEARAVLVRRLTDAVGIEVEPVASVMPDTFAVRCRITFEDGRFASAVGFAYFHEQMNDVDLTDEQLLRLATSRAMRRTLVDLFRPAAVELSEPAA